MIDIDKEKGAVANAVTPAFGTTVGGIRTHPLNQDLPCYEVYRYWAVEADLKASLAGFYLDFGFPPEDTHVLIDTPKRVFTEYAAHPTAKATGRTVHHLFAGRLVIEDDQIKLLGESPNAFAVGQALLPVASRTCPIRRKSSSRSSRSSRSPRTTGAEAVESSLPAFRGGEYERIYRY